MSEGCEEEVTVKWKLGGWVGINQGVRKSRVNKEVAGVDRLRGKQASDPEGGQALLQSWDLILNITASRETLDNREYGRKARPEIQRAVWGRVQNPGKK